MMSVPTPNRRPLTFRLSLFALLTAGLQAACGSSEPAKSPDETAKNEKSAALAGAPDWVTKDCRDAFPGKAIICGVGAVSGVASPSLARNAAMGRGRTEISRYLQIEVKSILRDYQAAKGAVIEQKIEEESVQVTEMTLSGSRMANYFIAPDGTYYALMVLGYDDFSASIDGATQLEAPLREALIKNAKKAFSSRDDETSRY